MPEARAPHALPSQVLSAAEPEETRDGAVAYPIEKHQAPTKSRRNAQACKYMPNIVVLALAERVLTVPPGFSLVDRREAHERLREAAECI
jgi:hypothetical protein